jgi:ATP-dependent Clp protease ATP-binding subunit ClpA
VNEGFSEEYGARPLRRIIQDSVENALAEYLLENSIENDKEMKEIKLGIEGNKVIVI